MSNRTLEDMTQAVDDLLLGYRVAKSYQKDNMFHFDIQESFTNAWDKPHKFTISMNPWDSNQSIGIALMNKGLLTI